MKTKIGFFPKSISLIIFTVILCFASNSIAKSLYVCSNTNSSNAPIDAYNINPDGTLSYQTSYDTNFGWGSVGLAIDSNSGYLFLTQEGRGTIQLIDGATMTGIDTIIAPGASNLAGIVVDYGNKKVYAVDRGSNRLYVYLWDSFAKTLTLEDGIYKTLESVNAYGIALDENSNKLYVASGNSNIKVFNTENWAAVDSIAVSPNAVSVAIDSARGTLYSCGWATDIISKYELSTGIETISSTVTGTVGLGVDQSTGVLYVTHGYSGDYVAAYDTSTTPFQQIYKSEDIGDPAGIAISEQQISYNPLNLSKNDTIIGTVSIGSNFSYEINIDSPLTDLTNVRIVDNLPLELDYISDSSGGIYDDSARTVTWDLDDIYVGEDTPAITLDVKVNNFAQSETTILNYCTIESDQFPPTTVIDQDPNDPNDNPGVPIDATPPLDISITTQPLSFNNVSPFLPNVLEIEAKVVNNSQVEADHVIVKFMLDGTPIGDGQLDLGSIGSLQEKDVVIEWAVSSDIENATLEVVVELEGQEDSLPSNNNISQPISFYWVDFRHGRDAFNFKNWAYDDIEDYFDEMNTVYEEGSLAGKISSIYGGWYFSLMGAVGHCYGMAATSTHWFVFPEDKRDQIDTYQMHKENIKADIIEHHWSQLIHLPRLFRELKISYDAEEQYNLILDDVKTGSPIAIALSKSDSAGGHAVTAYSVLDLGDEKTVYYYDNNYPLGSSIRSAGHVNFKLSANETQAGNYDRVIAIPIVYSSTGSSLLSDLGDGLSSAANELWETRKYFFRTKSPVKTLMTDASGRRIGFVGDVFVNEIPDAKMEIQVDSELFHLPSSNTYYVEMMGTDEGTLGVDIIVPLSSSDAKLVEFEELPVSMGSKITMTLNATDNFYHIFLPSGKLVEPSDIGIVGASDILRPSTFDTVISNVELYYSVGWIKNPEIKDGLLDKLNAAQRALDRGQKNTMVKILNAFINQLQSDKNVDPRAIDYLSVYINYIIKQL